MFAPAAYAPDKSASRRSTPVKFTLRRLEPLRSAPRKSTSNLSFLSNSISLSSLDRIISITACTSGRSLIPPPQRVISRSESKGRCISAGGLRTNAHNSRIQETTHTTAAYKKRSIPPGVPQSAPEAHRHRPTERKGFHSRASRRPSGIARSVDLAEQWQFGVVRCLPVVLPPGFAK